MLNQTPTLFYPLLGDTDFLDQVVDSLWMEQEGETREDDLQVHLIDLHGAPLLIYSLNQVSNATN